MLFVIDTVRESIAVAEAEKLGIPVAAILDSNSNPGGIRYPIPGNDDALRAITLYCNLATEAILDGIRTEMANSDPDSGAAIDPLPETIGDLPAEPVSAVAEDVPQPAAVLDPVEADHVLEPTPSVEPGSEESEESTPTPENISPEKTVENSG